MNKKDKIITSLLAGALSLGLYLGWPRSPEIPRDDTKERNRGLVQYLLANTNVVFHRKYDIPESIGTIVHLLQSHADPLKEDTAEGKNKAATVQKSMYNIITNLPARYGIPYVASEGVTERTSISKLKNRVLEAKRNKSDVDFWHSRGAEGELLVQEEAEIFPTIWLELQREYVRRYTEVANQYANDGVRGHQILANDPVVKRVEDAAVSFTHQALKQNSAKVIFLLYGSRHDIRDNLAEWNKNNPKQKMAYIFVVPRGLE